MSTIVGTWLLRMKTPVGAIEANYRFEEEEGVIRGVTVNGDALVGESRAGRLPRTRVTGERTSA